MFVRLFFGNGSLLAADSIACDSSLYIVFNCTPTLDGQSLQYTDIISVDTRNLSEIPYYGSVSYEPDSLNIILISGSDLHTNLNDSIILDFQVSSASRACIIPVHPPDYSSYMDSSCTLHITAFNAYSYTIEFTDTTLCEGQDSIYPPIMHYALEQNITFSSDAGLYIDSNTGLISPDRSTPGNYTVTYESDYCLTDDQVEISIIDVLPLNLFDTLTLCEGASISQEGVNLEEFTVLGSLDNTPVEGITEMGEYTFYTDQDGCRAVDTVFIKVLEGPEFTIDEQEECDRKILQVNVNSNSNTTVHWSNGVNDEVNEIFEDQMLVVEVIDDKGCITKDSLLAEVNILEILSVQMQKQEADCWEEGSVNIIDSDVRNNIGDFEYRLQNTLTGQLLTSLNEVPEGIYNLQVIDNHDCVATYEEKITVLQKCIEEYPVFTPNGDDIEDEYFIPHEGSVKIYNRDGTLLKELTTPAYWNGQSDAGDALPMGNYFIITDTGKVVNITIVK